MLTSEAGIDAGGGGILLLLLALALVRFTKKEWRPGNVFAGWDMVGLLACGQGPVCFVLGRRRRQITLLSDDAAAEKGASLSGKRRMQPPTPKTPRLQSPLQTACACGRVQLLCVYCVGFE